MAKGTKTQSGRLYERRWDGSLHEVSEGEPDVVICRRVVDFPGGTIPAGGSVTTCRRCEARIVFNPANPVAASTPKICMQCAQIEPLPIETS